MGIHRVYIEGSTKMVKWLSDHNLRAVDGVTTVIDSSKNHQPLKAVEISGSELAFPYSNNYVVKAGKVIATWRVIEDHSITGIGYLITPYPP